MDRSVEREPRVGGTAILIAALVAVFPYLVPIPDIRLPKDEPPPTVEGIGTPVAEAPVEFGLAREILTADHIGYVDEASTEDMERLFDYYASAMRELGWSFDEDERAFPERGALAFSRSEGEVAIIAARENDVSWRIDVYICPPAESSDCAI